MIGPGHVIRLFSIQRSLIRHRLDKLILTIPLLRPFSFLHHLLPWNWRRRDDSLSRGRHIHDLLQELGPIYVKLGQMLSVRRDMIADDIADELALLQDRVPPFPGAAARDIIAAEYGCPLEEVFSEFSDEPIASASIAQVHGARLHDGREVIVKVLRPNMGRQIDYDLSFMRLLAELMERYSSQARVLKVSNVVIEFEKVLRDEMDLTREAANASQLRRNAEGSELLYIPAVEWNLTTRRVMVMERISGIPVNDKEGLRAAGLDLRAVAERGVQIFFTQVFRDSLFHADLHPGNIFVTLREDGGFHFSLVDFGIVSSLSEYDQRYLAENFIAFLNRDYQRVARLHVESGWVDASTRIDEFEAAVRAVCEPLLNRPLQEIAFGDLLLRLFQTARTFNMEILPQLLLLQKTLTYIDALGRHLCPQIDLWSASRPLLEDWMKRRMGVRGVLRDMGRETVLWLPRLPTLPQKLMSIIEHLERGKLQVVSRTEPAANPPATAGGRAHTMLILGSALIIEATLIHLLATAPWAGATSILLATGGGVLLLLGLRDAG